MAKYFVAGVIQTPKEGRMETMHFSTFLRCSPIKGPQSMVEVETIIRNQVPLIDGDLLTVTNYKRIWPWT